MAGGQAFPGKWGTRVAPNLTKGAEGLGALSEADFVARFHRWRDSALQTPCEPDQLSPMPWVSRAGMTDADLGSIWAYLRSLPERP